MELGLAIAMGVALLVAGISGGLAYGYRNARDTANEQVRYLREQIAKLMPSPGPGGPVMQKGSIHLREMS